jgi:hypothetical protein
MIRLPSGKAEASAFLRVVDEYQVGVYGRAEVVRARLLPRLRGTSLLPCVRPAGYALVGVVAMGGRGSSGEPGSPTLPAGLLPAVPLDLRRRLAYWFAFLIFFLTFVAVPVSL